MSNIWHRVSHLTYWISRSLDANEMTDGVPHFEEAGHMRINLSASRRPPVHVCVGNAKEFSVWCQPLVCWVCWCHRLWRQSRRIQPRETNSLIEKAFFAAADSIWSTDRHKCSRCTAAKFCLQDPNDDLYAEERIEIADGKQIKINAMLRIKAFNVSGTLKKHLRRTWKRTQLSSIPVPSSIQCCPVFSAINSRNIYCRIINSAVALFLQKSCDFFAGSTIDDMKITRRWIFLFCIISSWFWYCIISSIG